MKPFFHIIAKLLLVSFFFLTLSTVFINDKNLVNGVVSGKYFWFYGCMGLVSITTFIYSFTQKKVFRLSLTDILVLLFIGSVFLSSFVVNSVPVNTTKPVLLTLLFVLYACLRLVLETDNKNIQTAICIFIILTGLIEAVFGLQQIYGFKFSPHNLFTLTGSFFNPGPYAGYLAVIFPLALYELMVKNEELKIKRTGRCVWSFLITSSLTLISLFLSLSSVIAISLVLPASMSRSSWLAVFAGSIVVIIGKYRSSLSTLISSLLTKKWLKVILFVVSLFLLIAIFSGMYYLKKNSADGRLLIWKISLTAAVKNPFGVGLGQLPGVYGETQAAYFSSGNASETEKYIAGNPEYGFNEFLQIAIESGIITLLIFIGIIICVFQSLIMSKNWGVLGSLVALLVFACFSYPFSVLPFPIILVYLLSMSGSHNTQTLWLQSIQVAQMEQVYSNKTINKSVIIRFIYVTCVLLITTLCLWKQYTVYNAYKNWYSSQVFYINGMYKEASQKYEPLYPYLKDQIQFLFEYGHSLSKSVVSNSKWIEKEMCHFRWPQQMTDRIKYEMLIKSNEVLKHATQISCDPMLFNIIGKNYQEMREYDLAEQNLLKSTMIVPNRLYPYYLLMKLYIEMGVDEKARKVAEIVLTKEPKVQSRAVEEMREEAGKVKSKR